MPAPRDELAHRRGLNVANRLGQVYVRGNDPDDLAARLDAIAGHVARMKARRHAA